MTKKQLSSNNSNTVNRQQDEQEIKNELYKFRLEMEKGERSIVQEGSVSSDDLWKELGI